MFIEKISHPTSFNVLSADILFATVFTVTQSSSNVVTTSTLSVGELEANFATIKVLSNPVVSSIYTTVNLASTNWETSYTTVNTTSSNWSNVYTTTQNNSSNWSGVYSLVIDSSANYILQNGNSPASTLLVGTNNSQALQLETNSEPRVTITSSGNVGVGQTSPTASFEVSAHSTSDAVRIVQTNTGNALAVYDVASDTTPFVINQDGRVGIGISSPTTPVDIAAASTAPSNVWAYGTDIVRIKTGGSFSEPAITFQEGSTDVGAKIGVKNRLNGAYDIVFANRDNSSTTSSLSERVRIKADGFVGIGTNDPEYRLDVAGVARFGGPSTTTGDIALEVGVGRTDSGNAYLDLVGDTTYTDFGARLIRGGGANANSELKHRGTGSLLITTQDSAPITLQTANTDRLTITTSGRVGIGTSNPTSLLTLSGTNVVFAVDNQAIFSAKNTTGTYDSYLWPRWSDNATYFNYGTGGLNVRNNTNVLRIRVTDAGDVGFNTTTPTAQITLSATSTEHADLNLQSGANSRFWITQPNNLNVLAIGGNGNTVPASGVVNITNNNRVGIGTTVPNATLTVIGDISATSGLTVDGNVVVGGTITSQGVDFGSTVTANNVTCKTSQQLVLNAGESSTVATGQTDELVYINAEGGLRVTSSPDDWQSVNAWNQRSSVLICGLSGNSAFGLSGSYINATPQATLDVFGLVKFGNRTGSGTQNAPGGFLSQTWTAAENFKFFTLGSSYFNPFTFRWLTNPGNNWGSNNVVNIAGDTQGVKVYTSSNQGAAERSETTAQFNAHERMRIDLTGNVGIGTTAPNERLTVAGNVSAIGNLSVTDRVGIGTSATTIPLTFRDATGEKIRLFNNYSLGIESGELRLATNGVATIRTGGYTGTERLRISPSGDIFEINGGSQTSTATLFKASLSATSPAQAIYAQFSNTHPSANNSLLTFANVTQAGQYISNSLVGDTVIRSENNNLSFASLSGVRIGAGTGFIERVRINSNGLSIAETGQTARDPIAPLTLSNATNTAKIDLFNDNSTRTGIGLGSTAGTLLFYTEQNGNDNQGILFGYGSPGSFTERVRFRKNGNVHIGDASAQTTNSRLAVNPTTLESKITLWDNGDTLNHFGFGVTSGQLNYHTKSGSHVFYNNGKNGNGTELMRITSTGSVGIGTNNPQQTFHTVGTSLFTGNMTLSSSFPRLNFQDIEKRGAAVIVDDGYFSVRRTDTNSTAVTTLSNSQHPLMVNLESGDTNLGGNLNIYGLNAGQLNGTNTPYTALALYGTAGTNRYIAFSTDVSPLSTRASNQARWLFGADNSPENGSNTGSDFKFWRYDDAGAFVDHPIILKRDTGNIGIKTLTPTYPVTVNGGIGCNNVVLDSTFATDLTAGALQYSDTTQTFFATPNANIRNTVKTPQYYLLNADRSLGALNAGQSASLFGVGCRLQPGKHAYRIVCTISKSTNIPYLNYAVASTTGTIISHTYYVAVASNANRAAVVNSQLMSESKTGGFNVLGVISNSVSSGTSYINVIIEGIIDVSTEVTGFNPQIGFTSGAPGIVTARAGSYIEIWPLGGSSNTNTAVGSWA